eukprot:1093558-Pyramimonas_sp.AAC.1
MLPVARGRDAFRGALRASEDPRGPGSTWGVTLERSLLREVRHPRAKARVLVHGHVRRTPHFCISSVPLPSECTGSFSSEVYRMLR